MIGNVGKYLYKFTHFIWPSIRCTIQIFPNMRTVLLLTVVEGRCFEYPSSMDNVRGVGASSCDWGCPMSISCVLYTASIHSIRGGLWDLTEDTFKSGCVPHEPDYLFDPFLGVQSTVRQLGLPP